MDQVPEACGPRRAEGNGVRIQPRTGDVLVERESGFPVTFVIRPVPYAAPLAASTRDAALRVARRLAADSGVDLWYCEHGAYRLLEMYRAGPPGPAAA